jgi:hypothetical protein
VRRLHPSDCVSCSGHAGEGGEPMSTPSDHPPDRSVHQRHQEDDPYPQGGGVSANPLYGFGHIIGSGAILVMRFDLAVWMYI